RPVVTQQALHLFSRYERLHGAREPEPQYERPQGLPEHEEPLARAVPDRGHDFNVRISSQQPATRSRFRSDDDRYLDLVPQSAAGFTTFDGCSPASTARTPSAATWAMRVRVATDALPMCGRRTVRGAASRRGCTSGSRS